MASRHIPLRHHWLEPLPNPRYGQQFNRRNPHLITCDTHLTYYNIFRLAMHSINKESLKSLIFGQPPRVQESIGSQVDHFGGDAPVHGHEVSGLECSTDAIILIGVSQTSVDLV